MLLDRGVAATLGNLNVRKGRTDHPRSCSRRIVNAIESLECRRLLAFFVTMATDNAPLSGGQGSGNEGDLR
jgi:hypothetical protein